jgi:hypothetical protein
MRFVALMAFIAVPGFLPAQHVGVINPSRGMQAPAGAYQYGNILFPGGIPSTHAGRLGGTVAGNPPYTGIGPGVRPGPGRPGGGGPGGRPRTVIVPYAYPVYMGGGYYDSGYDQQPNNVTVVVPQQPAPTVVINNSYVPETAKPVLREYSAGELEESAGIRVYEGPKSRTVPAAEPSGRSIMDEKPTIYLIALKDGSIRQAIGYWQQGDTFHYVTPESSINHLSVAMVDRDRSIELNAERKLEFDLKIR